MHKVAISHRLYEDGMKVLEKEAVVTILDKKTPEITEVDILGQEGLIIRIGTIGRTAIERSPDLRVLGRPGVGVDNVDMKAATEAGIPVVVTPNANSLSVAEHAVTLILAFAKDLLFQDREFRKGRFEVRSRYKAFEIQGKTLGLVGFGNIGRETAKLCAGLGMKVLVYDPVATKQAVEACGYGFCSGLDELLTAADAVSLHVPLVEGTRNLIGAKELRRMKKEALLVNCSRGGIVDETALYEALQAEVIAGAALDVFGTEPPDKNERLFTLDNVIVTPHMAAQTKEAAARMSGRAAEGVLAVLRGERWPHVANPEVYEHPRWKPSR